MRSGQVLVMTLLVLGVAVTVGLSIISRSVTEVRVSTTEEEAAKALEAAEAGVEKALGGVVAVGGSSSQALANSSFNVTNNSLGGGSVYEPAYLLAAGEVAGINLAGFGSWPGNVRVCWGDGTGVVPAVEVILYYRSSGGEVRVGRRGFDRLGRGNFEGASTGNCGGGVGRDYSYYRQFQLRDLGWGFGGQPLVLRVRMLYNTTGQPLGVRMLGGSLPTQGSEIISTGQAGEATQKLRVIQARPDLPLMFDAALFSGGGLVQ